MIFFENKLRNNDAGKKKQFQKLFREILIILNKVSTVPFRAYHMRKHHCTHVHVYIIIYYYYAMTRAFGGLRGKSHGTRSRPMSRRGSTRAIYRRIMIMTFAVENMSAKSDHWIKTGIFFTVSGIRNINRRCIRSSNRKPEIFVSQQQLSIWAIPRRVVALRVQYIRACS